MQTLDSTQTTKATNTPHDTHKTPGGGDAARLLAEFGAGAVGVSAKAAASAVVWYEPGLCQAAGEALVRRGVLNFHMLADSGMKGADGTIASRLEVHVYSCSLGDAEGEVAAGSVNAP